MDRSSIAGVPLDFGSFWSIARRRDSKTLSELASYIALLDRSNFRLAR